MRRRDDEQPYRQQQLESWKVITQVPPEGKARRRHLRLQVMTDSIDGETDKPETSEHGGEHDRRHERFEGSPGPAVHSSLLQEAGNG